MRRRHRAVLPSIVLATTILVASLPAQGISTGAIRGVVRSAGGEPVEDARVVVRNHTTGFTVATAISRGRFVVEGLETGGPYVVEVRRLGYAAQRSEPLELRLGQVLEITFVLSALPRSLDTIVVGGAMARVVDAAGGGLAATIQDSLVQRLTSINRNFLDFVKLAPNVSTKVGLASGGMSGGGALFRYNNYLIDGTQERFLTGNSSLAFGGGKSVPLEAIKEYQVLLTPFDVRHGDFAGALVNTITKSGGNRFEGTAFLYARNERLGRPGLPGARHEALQYGVALGGPIVRDRLHFFVAPELQRLTFPAQGPYVGQPAGIGAGSPISDADVNRLNAVALRNGIQAGSGGLVLNGTPQANVFARIDANVPARNSRLVVTVNHARTDARQFSRPASLDTFPLSTFRFSQPFMMTLSALQVHTALRRAGGGHNELRLAHRGTRASWNSPVTQPVVRVVVPNAAGGSTTVQFGTHPSAQGQYARSKVVQVADHLILPLGQRHVISAGMELERFRIERGGIPGSYGTWTFASVDLFERGIAESFQVRRDFGQSGAPLVGGFYSAYVANRWGIGESLILTSGIRADVLEFDDRAPYNAAVDSIFGRRTDVMPAGAVHLSPRLGFVWSLDDLGASRVRGGIGVFTGRPPLSWIHSSLTSYGVGVGLLSCGSQPTDAGLPPPFVADPSGAPTSCANGRGLTALPRGDVDLVPRRLRMAQTLRLSLAYDRKLPGEIQASTEALVTRNVSDFVFVNLNLAGPQGTDARGRVMYGRIQSNGVALPARRSGYSEVIDLRNTNGNGALQVAQRLERRYRNGMAAMASYTHTRARDVQTPLRAGFPGLVIWAGGRAVSGSHEELVAERSLNDIPHRVVLGWTYSFPLRPGATSLSLLYVGESGSPFTYLTTGVARRGDLNADGSNANDPIYVPRDARDTREIRFSGLSDSIGADNSTAAQSARIQRQQSALEQLIRRTPCMARQRGRIMGRNSCREPWSHTSSAALRQPILLRGRMMEAEINLFNALNLLSNRWGRYRVAAPALLEHVGQASSDPSQPEFRLNRDTDWGFLDSESRYQLQIGVRYRF